MPEPLAPAHIRIEEHLRRLIEESRGHTTRLPTEQQVAEEFGVSRMTARQAFQRLAGSGAIIRYRSLGSFVAPRVVEDLTAVGSVSFLERWTEQGFTVGLSTLAYDLRPVPSELASQLRLTKGSLVTYLERLRLGDGLPLALDTIYMPARIHELITEQELEHEQVVSLLPRHGIKLDQWDTQISARPAGEAEARPLGIRAGDVVIARETLDIDPDGKPVVYAQSVYPAGRVAYRMRAKFVTPQ